VHSASTVLAFLQKERGLLRPGNKFQPITRDDVLASFEARQRNALQSGRKVAPGPATRASVDPADPAN
jgi:hypothetical protein